jgi:transposase
MIFRQRFTARVFLNFLGRLLRLTRKTRKKVFLVVDGHPVHKARSVTRWLDEHREQIRVFFLPSYSPELNPDELLNQDVKTNALGRVRSGNDGQRSLLPADHAGEAHGGEELFL